ncbi:MAG: hypothetical protein V4582_11720 [Pseudomonadota bacterium]
MIKCLILIGLIAALLASNGARADGTADLKNALLRLRSGTPLKASMEVKTWHRVGEGKDALETSGQANVTLDDGAQGVQVTYSREFIARLEGEDEAVARDPNARTPATSAARELGAAELRPMLSAAAGLMQLLEKALPAGERIDSYKGKPARLLSYTLPISTLRERDRKYVKHFEATLNIWIDQDGTPLASRLREAISGRAFVVVGFEANNEEQRVYEVRGERLLAVRSDSVSTSAGAGERDERRVSRTMQAYTR